MTIGAWLRERAPAPPQLTARVAHALRDRVDAPMEEAADALVDSAERLLAEVIERPSAGRETALDLLTVDALVTYAFEAASARPETLATEASTAMRRLARLAAP